MPLDWLILPFNGLVSLFEDEFRDFIRLDRLSLWNGTREAILCSRRGIVFHHDFHRDDELLVKVDDISRNFEEVKAKYERRIGRLRDVCRPNRTILFVRSWREILHAPANYPDQCIRGVPSYDFRRLLEAITTCFPDINYRVLFVNYGPQVIDDPRALFGNVEDLGDIIDWTGSPGGWDKVFEHHDIKRKIV